MLCISLFLIFLYFQRLFVFNNQNLYSREFCAWHEMGSRWEEKSEEIENEYIMQRTRSLHKTTWSSVLYFLSIALILPKRAHYHDGWSNDASIFFYVTVKPATFFQTFSLNQFQLYNIIAKYTHACSRASAILPTEDLMFGHNWICFNAEIKPVLF